MASGRNSVFDGRMAIYFLAVLTGLVLATLAGPYLPTISSAWLVFSIAGTLIVYRRYRQRVSDLLKREENMADETIASSAEKSVDASINQSFAKEFSALKTHASLSQEDVQILEMVEGAIRDDRLELYLQPIVNLADNKISFYEAFSRMRDEKGFLLRPADYLETAEKTNRIGFIDNMILLRSVQAVRELQSNARAATIFCNISPATLYDQNFFSLFTQYLDVNPDLSSRLVFEFTYPAIQLVDPTIAKSLERLSERGFSFSVDHVHRLDLNLAAFKRLNLRYIKVPSALLVREDIDGDGKPVSDERFQTFRDYLRSSGVRIIIEKIESVQQSERCKALRLTYGQGNYFGLPRPAEAYIKPDTSLQAAS